MFDIRALYDNKGKTMSFKIPARSTGICIRNNYPLIVKLKSDQLPVGDYYYDRYDIVLTRCKDFEEIHIVGPVEQDIEFQVEIVVQYVDQRYDLRIYYEYHTPLVSSHQQRYQWTSQWSSCSVTCGTGFKSLIHTCTDIPLQTMVEDKRCKIKEYPAENRTTCIQRTCTARWHSGDWSACSTTCGVGTSTRQVVCVNGTECKVNRCAPRPLHECHHLTKPNNTMTCHQQPCQPVWRITHKSNCSQVCGIGEQRQIIKCMSVTNASLEVDDSLCKPEDKPAEFSMCCYKHCLHMNDDNKKECTDNTYCGFYDVSHCISGNIRKVCPHMCRVCGCVDKPECEGRTADACTNFTTWAKTYCSKTCGFCTSKGGYSVDPTYLLQCKYD
ncbi:A disintegrin and metalloproteinase with thrombospondin motifs 13-like [Mizuhopecten yessoensis]|uniref:A disintegrin and metalloproteinase with thrombospondin motifs 13-like n=1 Tax=Mizuhopecten yessoensis TaxID=6573 RepID=UPI000B45C5A9|nr:A disintegrin and metalloproteinase with thrombospondin motifs 13-like [Mizuhopecten yessoensis]